MIAVYSASKHAVIGLTKSIAADFITKGVRCNACRWFEARIFREVVLLARPAGAIEDFFIHADYDHETGAGTLRVDADVPARLRVPELGGDQTRHPEVGVHGVGRRYRPAGRQLVGVGYVSPGY